ncbi:MAG: class I SAM-dependent methyltransferase [Lachnospiraceae bacterium]|nr:class I SAM-dependent methyltransferase [Lachnospiraceae bacterium]
MDLNLGDVETTALIPLAIKASETLRDNPRIKDPKAVEIVKSLNIDTKPYDKFMSHEGVIARTIMLDRQLKDIIASEPESIIINIGSGFDSRFSRVDNGKILWFDIDLPDSINARKKVFPEQKRVTMIAGNALENAWCKEVKKKVGQQDIKPVILAEGLFMYFTMKQIQTFLELIKSEFSAGGTLIAEQNNKLMQQNEKHHDTVKSTKAHFASGTDSGQEIADLVSGFDLIEEHSFNEEMKKYSIRAKLFALIFPKFNDRWATFKW